VYVVISDKEEKLKDKGKKSAFLSCLLKRLASLSVNVDKLKAKQSQIGKDLGNIKQTMTKRQTYVDRQLSFWRKQPTCKILRYMIVCPILVV
jgi:predicted ATP-grasp superfamily ATP-dependent carboligase